MNIFLKLDIKISQTNGKNDGHNMSIVGEPCNVDAHANIPAVTMTMLWPLLGTVLYTLTVTVQLSC